MQNKILPVIIAATVFTCGARAQDVATPSSPAPAVQSTQQAVAQSAPTPNQVIYAPRLPTPAELTSAAAAQGQSVEQINQTSTQITVIYRNSAGQVNTVAYQLLPTTGSAPAGSPTVVVPNPAPATVIYQTSPSVIYYDSYRPYYPRYYYPPVSLSLGFGYGYYRGWGGGGGHHHHGR